MAGGAASLAWLAALAAPPANAQTAAAAGSEPAMSLQTYMSRVVDYNWSVQARLLAFHAARSQRKAEGGPFEPSWVTTGEYVDNRKANTVEIERYLNSGGIFRERNQNYSSALEVLSPVGTRIRLGATGDQLINNIQRRVFATLDAEYQTSVGLTIEQPLLKGAGRAANLAALRIAARGSDVAYQEYRRQLMQVTADAELAYWQLYFAQQEEKLTADSTAVAETLVRDSRANLDAGRGSNLDVLEAEAGVALRKSRESMAHQKRLEAANRLASFMGDMAPASGSTIAVGDAPRLREITISAADGGRAALAMNPDLLRAQALAGQDRVRLGLAKNQRLPQVDLKVSYAASGLGDAWRSSWTDVEREDFPLWTVGLEVRIPVFGNIRGRNEYRAARLRLLASERNVADLTGQIRAGIESAQQRVSSTYTAARSLAGVGEFRANLLRARMEGREVGRGDSRSVLEAEQDLFAARLDELQSSIEFERALLDLQQLAGTLLQPRGLEIGLSALEKETSALETNATAPVSALHYRVADFNRWPSVPPDSFVPDTDPSYPLRLRLTHGHPVGATPRP